MGLGSVATMVEDLDTEYAAAIAERATRFISQYGIAFTPAISLYGSTMLVVDLRN